VHFPERTFGPSLFRDDAVHLLAEMDNVFVYAARSNNAWVNVRGSCRSLMGRKERCTIDEVCMGPKLILEVATNREARSFCHRMVLNPPSQKSRSCQHA
jgi:hypothetical protein